VTRFAKAGEKIVVTKEDLLDTLDFLAKRRVESLPAMMVGFSMAAEIYKATTLDPSEEDFLNYARQAYAAAIGELVKLDGGGQA
jgi:hypothetical protein